MAVLAAAAANEDTATTAAPNNSDGNDDDEVAEAQAAYHPEQSTWAQDAEDDVSKALMRLAMLARDEHKKEPGRTVKQLYSERLARLIKEAEIGFDETYVA